MTARTLQTTDGNHDHATGVDGGDAPPSSPSSRDSSVDAVASHSRTVCSTCIVTFNSRATIGRLLQSVAEAGIATRVRILDNASTDDTVQVILAESAQLGLELTLQVSHVNVGFPRACNELLRLSCEPVIAVINPDVELTPGVLEHLAGVAHDDSSIGIVTCRLMTRSGRAQTAPARSRPRLRHLVVRDLPRRVGDVMRGGRPNPLSVDRDVECMSGALMVFRRDLLSAVGYLDDSVFMFLEDIDFAARVRRAGYRIRYVGTRWAWHDCGASSERHEARLYALLPRVWITYLSRYGSLFERALVRPFIFVLAAGTGIKRVLARESASGQLAAMLGALTYRAATPRAAESGPASPARHEQAW